MDNELTTDALFSLTKSIAARVGRRYNAALKGTVTCYAYAGTLRFKLEGKRTETCMIDLSYAGKPFSKHYLAEQGTLESFCLGLSS